MRCGQGLQRHQIGAARQARHADHVHAHDLQSAKDQKPGGVFHQNRVAGLQETANNQIQALGDAADRHQVVHGVRGNVLRLQYGRQVLAQRQVALRLAIAEQGGFCPRAAAGDGAHGPRDQPMVHPRGGQAAGASRAVPAFFKNPAQQVSGIELQWLSDCRALQRGGSDDWALSRYIEAAAPARLHQSRCGQLVVGLNHGVATDARALGQRADRGQAHAGAQAVVANQATEVFDQLLHQPDAAGAHGLPTRVGAGWRWGGWRQLGVRHVQETQVSGLRRQARFSTGMTRCTGTVLLMGRSIKACFHPTDARHVFTLSSS